MYYINKLVADSVVDFSAEELKKYLRMMMPEGGDVKIAYNPEAKDGFRLGLMQDLGLDTSDAEDTALDDILYIDCDREGGIIAGDNPRSVLLSVYEYLRQNGCRWLMPTVDGEYIPMKDIEPVKYRHKPTMRYRGWCNEGSEYQQCMINAIEFAPKVGMNTFMMEFVYPASYYKRHYTHSHNEENRQPEPISNAQVLQWKRQCETEIARRGLQFHDIGHGWTADPFGIDSTLRTWDGDNEEKVPPESRKYLALVKGERRLRANTPNYTNFCMSNPEARKKVADYAAEYARVHSNVTYLHVWLGDGTNCHCECDECKKKTPTDWYVMMLNEIDEELTKRELDTKVVFIAYVDTMWAPISERIKNQDRFALLLAPITRSYVESLPDTPSEITLRPFELNNLVFPKNLEENFAYFEEWKKVWGGVNLSYEYHFWYHQYFDPSMINGPKIINKDIKVYKEKGVNGIIEDGSQRSFFPNGFAFYTYARTLFDSSLSYEELLEDYFSTAYGENWKLFREYLEELSRVLDFNYIEGKKSADPEVSVYYNPDEKTLLEKVPEVLKRGRELIAANYNSDYRLRTVSVRLLELHAKYCEMLAEALIPKCEGNDVEAAELWKKFRIEIGKSEAEFEPFYDHPLIHYGFSRIFENVSKLEKKDINRSIRADF